MHFIIGLGSNLGSREANLRAAVELLADLPESKVVALSCIYETEPIGPPQPLYLNAAIRIESRLKALVLLSQLQKIEKNLGKKIKEHWGARTIDLDVLWSDEYRSDAEPLMVPHPCLEQRSFALAPLLDVAPELEEQYLPRLHDAGGRPPVVGSLSKMSNWQAMISENQGQIEVSSHDRADALAIGLGILSKYVCGCQRRDLLEARVIHQECASGSEGETLYYEAIKQVKLGFHLCCAALSSIEPGRLSARLLGYTCESQHCELSKMELDEYCEDASLCIRWMNQ